MSFFDDEPEDEPTRAARRPARPRQAEAHETAAPAPEDIVRRRQLILFGGLAVLALILILLVNSCADNRHKNGLKTYNREMAEILRSSDQEVSAGLFELLSGDAEADDATTTANRLRDRADANAKAARNLDVPGDLKAAHRNLELTLNLRAEGVRAIAGDLGAAKKTGRGAVDALKRIGGQMQVFLTSDRVYSQRTAPLVREALDDADLGGTRVGTSQFLPELGWLDFSQAAERINPDAGGAGSTPTGEPAPGTHGHGLTSVAIGETALVAGTAPTRVAVSTGLALNVTFQNQGENDEANVKVTARVQPTSGRTYETSKVVSQTKAGETANVSIPLTQAPAKNTTARITVTVGKVNGEQKTDNNTETYTVFFT
ncbi:MAG: hypothetical protein V9E83_08825 [Baekduia sp.]